MIRAVLFTISVLFFLSSAFETARRYQASHFLVLEDGPLNVADSLLAQRRWREAKYLAGFVKDNPTLGDTPRAQSIELAADTALDFLPLQGQDFLDGAISGEANNTAGLLGAMALDLFVIGDIRDILVQGYKELTEQDGDKIILALSAAGLTLALLPELHWAPAVMKTMKRGDALSEPFIDSLRLLAQQALKTGDFKPLAKLLTHFGLTIEKLGLGPSKGVMPAVHSADDMLKLANAAAVTPQKTYAISMLAGQRGIGLLNRSGKNVHIIAKKLRHSSRLAKLASKTFSAIPQGFVLSVLVLSFISLIMVRPRRRSV